MAQRKRAVKAFTDHDAALIDDIRKAFDRQLKLDQGIPADAQKVKVVIAFERAVAGVVLERTRERNDQKRD